MADMTTTHLTRRRVIDLLRTASATCR
ncbi:putative leader peptide [Kribbella sp. NPDC051137]